MKGKNTKRKSPPNSPGILAVWRGCPAILSVAILVTTADGKDWPQWRGPEQNGASAEQAVVTTWSLEGEQLLWKIPEGGRTTPIVMAGRVFAIAPVGEGVGRRERVVALDGNNGNKVWERSFNVFHTDIVENRVGWTALAGDPETGYVYAHGTGGELFCFSRDGQLVWKVSLTEGLGRISGYGGRLHTPIVDEDRVVVSFLNSSWGAQARPLHRYAAFDKRTGKIIWWAAPGGRPLDTTYSTPAVAMIGGRRLLVAANADGNVYGMRARTGKRIWTFRLSKRGLNSSVVVDGDYAYVSHSEENLLTTKMGSIVCIDATKEGDITETGAVWRLDGYPVGYASPAIANGRLYVVSNGANLYSISVKTGKVHWEYSLGRVGKGSPTVTADGVIYVGEQNGIFHILRDGGDHCIPLDREVFTAENGAVDELFGSPAVVNGRVYLMTRYATYCLGKSGETGQVLKAPIKRKAVQRGADSGGTLQIAPAEVTVRPGEKIQFHAREFDSTGSVKRVQPEWIVTGARGMIASDGTFTAAPEQTFSAGRVTAKSRTPPSRQATARLRISPSLPVRENFESMAAGSAPPGWVGVVNKAKVVEHDSGKVLKKLASKQRPSPPFMRLRGYATPPIQGGCSVEADLLGTLARGRFKPDMGLINSRYRFVMMGMSKKLRIETWSPLPRLRQDVAFEWQANQWYRVKFDVSLEGEQARVRAKVWKKDEKEPDHWHIEAVDPYPNREGSAGVYGYSTGTTSKSDGPEILYDNFTVVRND